MGSPTNSPVKKKACNSPSESSSHLEPDSNIDDDILEVTSVSTACTSPDKKKGTLLTFLKKFDDRKDYEEYLRENMIRYKEEKANRQQVLQELKGNRKAIQHMRIREGNAERQRRKRQRKREDKEESVKRGRTLVWFVFRSNFLLNGHL
jgi:hypothetical protein